MEDNLNRLIYKGYVTRIHFNKDDKVLHGKLLNISDLVNFESVSAVEIEAEFHKAVDDYLAFCKEVGKTAQTMRISK